MALASAAPANAVPEGLRNSRRVVRLGSVRLVEFIVRKVLEFAKCGRFIAVGPIIPLRPALGKAVQGVFSGLQVKAPLLRSRSECLWWLAVCQLRVLLCAANRARACHVQPLTTK